MIWNRVGARLLLKSLTFGLLISPIMGVVMGWILVVLNCAVVGDSSMLAFGLENTALLGCGCGALYGVVCAWPLRRFSIAKTVCYVAGGALATGVPGALLPLPYGGGITAGCLGAVLGAVIGTLILIAKGSA